MAKAATKKAQKAFIGGKKLVEFIAKTKLYVIEDDTDNIEAEITLHERVAGENTYHYYQVQLDGKNYNVSMSSIVSSTLYADNAPTLEVGDSVTALIGYRVPNKDLTLAEVKKEYSDNERAVANWQSAVQQNAGQLYAITIA